MDSVYIPGSNYHAVLINTLVELHAKQDAQTNLLVDFLSAISKKPHQELMDSINIRTKQAKGDILSKLYGEYGEIPDDLKRLLDSLK